MFTPHRISRIAVKAFCSAASLALAVSCHNGSSSPTSPGMATINGTVIRGSGTFGARPLGLEIPLSGVTVRVITASGPSTQSDASGNFTLTGAPAGNVDLEFTRADINARGSVVLASGSNSITASIAGGTAVITSRGHAGEEIEGRVVSVNLANGTLVVQDQRLGNVNITVSVSTIIRKGNASILLSAIGSGFQVHVKAMQQGDGTYIATEILIQDDKEGGEGEVEGSVASVNSAAASFVVTAPSGPITVKTGPSTTFKKKGSAASFSDVTVGAIVEAEGTLQSDGSILARKVTIE
ncbi:MAG TPA: DUF5666 domain-containing protein [Thermoanaerobaculia bacterium]|nr:DUF5666 domain-containing protein [Thermoanaerobaculia bacterium]